MDAPALCPAHGTPFCYECAEDVADVSMLRREVVGPHPITGQVIVRFIHRDGCPGEAEEAPIVGHTAPTPPVPGRVSFAIERIVGDVGAFAGARAGRLAYNAEEMLCELIGSLEEDRIAARPYRIRILIEPEE